MPRGRGQDVANREQEKRALEMRRLGASYREIAEQLGLQSATSAMRVWQRALRRYLPPPLVEEERQRQLDLLDRLEAETWRVFATPHYVLHNGQVVQAPANQVGQVLPMLDDGPKLQAIALLKQLAERRSSLLGLDAPKRIAVQHVTLDDVIDAIEQGERELAQLEAAERAAQARQADGVIEAHLALPAGTNGTNGAGPSLNGDDPHA